MCGWGDGEELIMKSWCSEYKCWCRSATPTSLTDEDTGNKVKGSRERPPTWEINISRRWSNLLSPVSTQEVRVWVWLWSPCFSIILLLWTKGAHSTHSVYLFHSYYIKSRSQQSIFQDGGVQDRSRTGETRWVSPICQHCGNIPNFGGVADCGYCQTFRCKLYYEPVYNI